MHKPASAFHSDRNILTQSPFIYLSAQFNKRCLDVVSIDSRRRHRCYCRRCRRRRRCCRHRRLILRRSIVVWNRIKYMQFLLNHTGISSGTGTRSAKYSLWCWTGLNGISIDCVCVCVLYVAIGLNGFHMRFWIASRFHHR